MERRRRCRISGTSSRQGGMDVRRGVWSGLTRAGKKAVQRRAVGEDEVMGWKEEFWERVGEGEEEEEEEEMVG